MTYLRAPRIIVFNLTMALCNATAALAIWGLVVGYQNKSKASKQIPGAVLHIQDAFAAGGSVAAASGLASLLCFFVLLMALFRRHSPETIKTVRMKEYLFGFSLLAWIGTLIPATYIWRTKSGVITKAGVPASVINQILALGQVDLRYSKQTALTAQIIVGWIAFLSMAISTALVIAEARYVLKHGRDGPLLGHLHEKNNQSVDEHNSIQKRESETA